MTAPAKAPARRTIAVRRTYAEAVRSRDAWKDLMRKDADVKVEPNAGPKRDTHPWAVTAAKAGAP